MSEWELRVSPRELHRLHVARLAARAVTHEGVSPATKWQGTHLGTKSMDG